MANSHFDENHQPTLTGVLKTDGKTIVNAVATAANHALNTATNVGGSDFGPSQAKMDENRTPIAMAVSSADFVTPVAIYIDASGKLITS